MTICRKVFSASLLLWSALSTSAAQATEPVADNETIAALYKIDQDERGAKPRQPWEIIAQHDAEHAERVITLLREGAIRTPTDYCRAALIFHHGDTLDKKKLAYSLAWIGFQLDPANRDCALISAQAWDRILITQGRPQWYGTQYGKRDANSSLSGLLPIDKDAVSNEERARYGVDPQ
ncbi:MAG TPA: hypothetical protein VF472_01000 [Burkholderiaceae bacterium]